MKKLITIIFIFTALFGYSQRSGTFDTIKVYGGGSFESTVVMDTNQIKQLDTATDNNDAVPFWQIQDSITAGAATATYWTRLGDLLYPETIGDSVGVNTATPETPFHVNGNSTFGGRLIIKETGNSVFIGEGAGENDDLSNNNNVLVGYTAGANNTGVYSNGFGYSALQDNTGINSNGFGANTLSNNSGAYSNGFGDNALQENTGIYSNGFGSSALLSNTGDNSNGVGSSALANNTGASSNGVGANALQENTGDNSNGFGSSALENNTGANNTAVGHNTSSSDPFAFTNTTALGYNVQPNASNQVMLGDTNVTDVYLAEDGTATANIGKIQLAALNTAPSSAAATGTLGEVRWDASYMYVCTATNTWKRSAIATW